MAQSISLGCVNLYIGYPNPQIDPIVLGISIDQALFSDIEDMLKVIMRECRTSVLINYMNGPHFYCVKAGDRYSEVSDLRMKVKDLAPRNDDRSYSVYLVKYSLGREMIGTIIDTMNVPSSGEVLHLLPSSHIDQMRQSPRPQYVNDNCCTLL